MSLRNAVYSNAEHTAAGVGDTVGDSSYIRDTNAAAADRITAVAVSCGIGDIASDARGSGARFNTGKTPVELIPIWLIADYYDTISGAPEREAMRLLYALGAWQGDKVNAREVLAEFAGDWTTDCARVFDYGRKKYAEWNWAKGMAWSIPLACAVRHLLAILRGEENDPESGLPHRGHVAANIVMLAQYEVTYREGDDRPTKWLVPEKAA